MALLKGWLGRPDRSGKTVLEPGHQAGEELLTVRRGREDVVRAVVKLHADPIAEAECIVELVSIIVAPIGVDRVDEQHAHAAAIQLVQVGMELPPRWIRALEYVG